MADRFEFTLGSVETSILGQAFGVDVRRFPLRVRNTTTDPVRLAKLASLVLEDLRQRGLGTTERLHPSLETAFGLFDGHRVAVAVTGIDGLGEDIAVLVYTDGAQALGITQGAGQDDLLFALFSDDDLIEVLAGVPPAAKAAPGGPLSVRERPEQRQSAMAARRAAEAEHDFEETDAFGNIEVAGVVQAGDVPAYSDHTDAERLAEILSGRRLGGGQIFVSGRGRHGERRDAPPLSWLDTERGRYLVQTGTDEAGAFVATYSPAGRDEVARAMREAVSSVY
ncbi:ESX secretion-associated protein EspG [Amycolatopsis anabasis]|uniref:ESX secretion-associated protein EspG n=1 Tax=Amycolatopsis anabasis TaxID=1840409 RepID=UPI00131ACCFF|nr:ESX secretion-associated protein EspG [Amycolatopsis anabasis]